MTSETAAFVDITCGARVRSGGKNYQITALIGLESVLAKDLETGESEKLRIESLSLPTDTVATESPPWTDVSRYTKGEWKEAQRRMKIIQPLVDDPMRTRGAVEAVAKENAVHAATLYKWIATFQRVGHAACLVPEKRGRKKGSRLLDDRLEQVIKEVIEENYLSKARATAQDVITAVHAACRLSKLDQPHPNTIRRRIDALPKRRTLTRRGRKDQADSTYSPILGKFPGANFPLETVQIDHTPANVIVVSEVSRLPIGRPYLTLAIDVYSRMVVGFLLSLDPPSTNSVGLCLSHAICTKRDYLAKVGVEGSWPAYGVMRNVHADNAKEFHSDMLKRAADKHLIDLQWRPAGRPHYGGHIERLMGVAANVFQQIPGKTFASPTERKGYDSEKEAVMTLREVEAYFVDFIVNKYHQKRHSELETSPIKAWERGLLGDGDRPGIGIPKPPADPARIRMDFMPLKRRTCQRYGFQWDNITYYDPVIDPYINAKQDAGDKRKTKFVIRRDPRDVSEIYFYDPVVDTYHVIPYQNRGRPAASLWEVQAAIKKLKDDGKKDIDEDLIFATIARLRDRIDKAAEKTRSARRQAARRPSSDRKAKGQLGCSDSAIDASFSKTAPAAEDNVEADDLWDSPIEPFDMAIHR